MTEPMRRETAADEVLPSETPRPTPLSPPREAERERPRLVERKDEPTEARVSPGTQPIGATSDQEAGAKPAATEPEQDQLFPSNELEQLRARWDAIQTAFVDEPRSAVHDADQLVSTVIQRLAEVFSDQRTDLEKKWNRGDSGSTEDLRLAFQRYRALFRRVLSV
jgi:hypothetical protein